MVGPVTDWVAGTIALLAVGIGFIFHLGWKHGWDQGFRAGRSIEITDDEEEHQPAVHSPFSLLYALGWHLGWDFGFRKGFNNRGEKARKGRG